MVSPLSRLHSTKQTCFLFPPLFKPPFPFISNTPKMDHSPPKSHLHIVIQTPPQPLNPPEKTIKSSFLSTLARFHAGYFRISLSLCSQALLWKILKDQSIVNPHLYRRLFQLLPSTAFLFLWSISLCTLISLSLLYVFRCFFHFRLVKAEFLHHVGVNYLFAPSISCLLLLQSSPFFTPKSNYYLVLWWVFVAPMIVLDVKIYGQWFIKGKRSLSVAANPASQLSVIGNLIGARGAALMGWEETSICLFSLGMTHYVMLFVTLYQRLSGGSSLPTMLRPVFFLFIAAPSVASLAWDSIAGKFDNFAKMLFFLSLFLFLALVSRPKLFVKATRKFNVAWWAYSFPLTVLALASADYAQEVKGGIAHGIMLLLSSISVFVSLSLIFFTVKNTNRFFPSGDPSLSPNSNTTSLIDT